jgi:chaperonin GroES
VSAKKFPAPSCGATFAAYFAAERFGERRTPNGPFNEFQPSSSLKEDTMKFRPLHDRVVVKRLDAEEKTAGGIIIPDTAQEKPMQGEIVAVGPGGRDEAGKLIPIDLKVGDRVLFGKWSGTEVKIDGKDLLIMKESDVMGVLEGEVAKKKAA